MFRKIFEKESVDNLIHILNSYAKGNLIYAQVYNTKNKYLGEMQMELTS